VLNLIKSISNRYSPRSFGTMEVEKEKLELIFEAARWAPSSFNNQPWRFFVANKNENLNFYNDIINCLTGFNKSWADTAPILIVTVVKTTFDHNNLPNKHAWHDLGLAVGNMLNQATEIGLFMHQMAGIEHDKIATLLNLSSELEPVTVIALGYLGKIEDLPAEIQKVENEKQRVRKQLSEIIIYSPLN